MPTYREAAVVLRTHKLGEADRIVTLLTRGRGRVRAVARGVRRTKSRFGARLEPGMVVDVQCYEGRNLDTITQADVLAACIDHARKLHPDCPVLAMTPRGLPSTPTSRATFQT